MVNWEQVIRSARDCHTKRAWEAFFSKHGDGIATSNNPKPIAEIFKLLAADPQSLQYDDSMWSCLIRGCISSWNLELGREIADLARKLPSPEVAIPAAQVYLERSPAVTREIANRTLRLAGLQPRQILQLEMLICSSYAEEGKQSKAIRMLNRMTPHVRSFELNEEDRADFLARMGRMLFFLGRYQAAGGLFHEAAEFHLKLEDWEGAAKALFNAAACFHNSGGRRQDEAFPFIEECRRISEAHQLAGPLAHCEAFYGVNALYHGEFASAIEHLRSALGHLPASDQSFRRLHIISMLALTYLETGRYHLARKYGSQTLELAALDESERYKARYLALEASLKWEDGEVDESQEILRNAIHHLSHHGIHILEEMSTYNRYVLQCALLGDDKIPAKIRSEESLKKNIPLRLERFYALGQHALNLGHIEQAEEYFNKTVHRSRNYGSKLHEARGLLGLFQTKLVQKHPIEELQFYSKEFNVSIGKLGDTPLKAVSKIVQAAIAYRIGDFKDCERLLRDATKGTRVSFGDRFVANCWIATIEGRSCRLSHIWQEQMLARATRVFFQPEITAIDKRIFHISGQYTVNLERHAALAELLHFLLQKSNFSSSPSEIQTRVWKQSLKVQGWHQKIRNTVMRLRDFLPYTMAPLLIHNDGELRLFHEAIRIVPGRKKGATAEDEILRLLRDGAMSSTQLSERLQTSSATTKRILKRLNDNDVITSIRHGRNVLYVANPAADQSSLG